MTLSNAFCCSNCSIVTIGIPETSEPTAFDAMDELNRTGKEVMNAAIYPELTLLLYCP